jgi:hypothetical protein
MEHKGPRPATNIAFVIILAATLGAALFFTYEIAHYAMTGIV